MCGIYGITKVIDGKITREKLRLMSFRGPDYSSYKTFEDHSITLGHNRLAIIDLDSRSNQPLEFDGLWIVFNGEIYNFLELKEKLEKRGYRFRTSSDTEVIVACYKEFGTNCPAFLNGMFAFVIYDPESNILFGARDRLGKKPFHYRLQGGVFEFASMASIIVKGERDVAYNSTAVGKYLLWGKIPDPYSIFEGVVKLPAGCAFTFNLVSKKFSEEKYWDLNFNGKLFCGDYKEAKHELKALLYDSVKTRLIADVPVGVFLSGGIDSSLIAAQAQAISANPIHTFSIKFKESKFDESKYAKMVANQLGTKHTEIECTYDETINLIQSINCYYDEPFDDSSAIPSMLLAKHTRSYVTVALTGDGGDESFLGYTRYLQMAKKQQLFAVVPKPVRLLLAWMLSLIPEYRWKYVAEGLKATDVNELYVKSFTGHLTDWHSYREDHVEYGEFLYSQKKLLERISDFDLKSYLNNEINTKVDRATMAFSLEARSPLMDHRIVEFARSLPTEFKFQKNNQKRILKDILYDFLPRQLFDRPKAGFGMPMGIWFRTVLKDFMYDNLTEENLKSIPYLNVSKLNQYIEKHMSGEYDFSTLIWRLIQLIQWEKKYI